MMKEYNINQTTLKILGLYVSDYKRTMYLREIARETKVDVKAIQLQLKKLEAMNVLSSTVKGRNKEYSVNLGNLAAKYYMVLAETFASITYLRRNFLIKKTVNEIEDKIDGTIILFGSFAKGITTRQSDIDLYIITEKRLDRSVITEAGSLVGREMSVKSSGGGLFRRGLEQGDPLIVEVVSNHYVLKGIDNFCDIMWRYYARR